MTMAVWGQQRHRRRIAQESRPEESEQSKTNMIMCKRTETTGTYVMPYPGVAFESACGVLRRLRDCRYRRSSVLHTAVDVHELLLQMLVLLSCSI